MIRPIKILICPSTAKKNLYCDTKNVNLLPNWYFILSNKKLKYQNRKIQSEFIVNMKV